MPPTKMCKSECVCVQLQALSLMLWSYGKAIPPSAESAKLLSVVSDEVITLCLPYKDSTGL